MDIKTLILALAVGNGIFSFVLFIFQLTEAKEHRNTDWSCGKLLQSIGWYLLYRRGTVPDTISFTAGNITLLLGIAFETWAVLRIAGCRIPRRVRAASLLAVPLICVVITPLPSYLRIAAASLTTASMFAATGWGLLRPSAERSPLRAMLGWGACLVSIIVAARGLLDFSTPRFDLFTDNLIQEAAFLTMLAHLLVNGFGLLLLIREEADREILELTREQHAILETLPTGLCLLKNRVIQRCNPAFERMFGFPVGSLAGRSARCLFGSETLYREYGERIYPDIRDTGRFVGEVAYTRQNGEQFWAIDHGVRTSDGSDSFIVFSVTDISEQKRQQETLVRQKEALQETLDRTKRLEGMISICMHCKSIHGNNRSWERLEKYLMENSDAEFSHGICPDCYQKHYR